MKISLYAVALVLIVAVGVSRPAWAEAVDGHYSGTYSNVGQCVGGGPTELRIKDRAFTRRFGANVQFDVTVAPDGSFTSQYGQSTLTGSVRNGHVEMTLAAGRGGCISRQVLDKG